VDDIYMAGPWITELEERVVLDALRNGWYGKNAYHYVETFEAEFSKYHDRKFALMTPNCTTALHLLLAGLGIGEDDEVIAPDCTWVGSVACITYQRAKTVLADIDAEHWCLTPESIECAITPKTKAVIIVDLYGNMPDWDGILDVCQRRGIYAIEDAAESLGSKYRGVRAGKFGIGSTFSFHRTKTITTGEGGMLLMDDEKLFQRCKFLRDHGRAPGSYFNTEVTFKYMPFNLQAALGYAQFLRIDELIGKKRWILQGYRDRLSGIPDLYLNAEPAHV
jgi:perosamine synthetase